MFFLIKIKHYFLVPEIRRYFCKIVKEEQDVSVGVAAIRTLMEIIKHYKCMLQIFLVVCSARCMF